jgi:hypothetical protein
MDPEATLNAIRDLVEDIRCGDRQPSTAVALADAISDLDWWLSKGGLIPEQWLGDDE